MAGHPDSALTLHLPTSVPAEAGRCLGCPWQTDPSVSCWLSTEPMLGPQIRAGHVMGAGPDDPLGGLFPWLIGQGSPWEKRQDTASRACSLQSAVQTCPSQVLQQPSSGLGGRRKGRSQSRKDGARNRKTGAGAVLMWQSSGHSHPAWLASTASPLLPSLLCCRQKGWVC